MTAICMLRRSDRLHLDVVTDGAAWDPETGIVHAFHAKACVLPALSAVMCAQGNSWVSALAYAIEMQFGTFDEVIERGETALPFIIGEIGQRFDSRFDGRLLIGGWSERQKCMRFFALCTDSDGSFSWEELSGMVNAPDVSEADWLKGFGKVPRTVDDVGEIDHFARVFLELQRRKSYPQRDLVGHWVGGFAQRITLGRDHAEVKILHRWPDQIGAVISPEPFAFTAWRLKGAGAVDGMSKIKRDMLARKQAKIRH